MFRLAILVLFSSSLFFLANQESSARIILKEKSKYYSVSGGTGKEIYQNMMKNGPRIKGRMGHFLATTYMSYEFKNIDVKLVEGRCAITKFDLVVTADYTYPRWKGSKKASKKTRAAWKKYSKYLVWHEEQHTKIYMESAKKIEKLVYKLRGNPKRDCNDMIRKFKRKEHGISFRDNRAHKRFDRKDTRPGSRGYKADRMLWGAS